MRIARRTTLLVLTVLLASLPAAGSSLYHRYSGKYFTMPLLKGWTASDGPGGVNAWSHGRSMGVSYARTGTAKPVTLPNLESAALTQTGLGFSNIKVIQETSVIPVTSGVKQQNLIFTATVKGVAWEGQLDAGTVTAKKQYGVYAYLAAARKSLWSQYRANLEYMMTHVSAKG